MQGLLAVVLAGSLVAGGPALAQEEQDTILLKGGQEIRQKILSEDVDGVWFSVGGAKNVVRWNKVESIRYGNAAGFYKALETLSAGNLTEAIEQLEELLKDTRLRPAFRPIVTYHLAMGYQRRGDQDKAIGHYQTLLKESPRSRFLVSTGNNLLSAYLAKGESGKVTAVLDEVMKTALGAGIEAEVKAGLDLLHARVLELQGKLDEAQALYREARSGKEVEESAQEMARLGLARCLQEKGMAVEAEKEYRDLVISAHSPGVLAGAWNGIGDIAYSDGFKSKDSRRLREAMFAYLRPRVLYFSGDSSEEMERALYGLRLTFNAIASLETDVEKKKLWQQRSKESEGVLRDQYPGSPFLKKG